MRDETRGIARGPPVLLSEGPIWGGPWFRRQPETRPENARLCGNPEHRRDDIRRFEVAVHNPSLVGGVETFGDLKHKGQRLLEW
jgi:hypothetical protein